MKPLIRNTFLLLVLTAYSMIVSAHEKPVIGISSTKASSVGINYVKSVRKAGGVPLIIPITTDEVEIAKILETIDGLLMTGGEDVEPARYGEEAIPQLGKVNPERDEFDLTLVRQAVSKGIPVLAVCRGVQVMNVAFGGTLYQDIPSQLPQSHIGHKVSSGNIVAHSINIAEETLLYRLLGKTAEVNSIHHQSVKDVAPGFIVSAVSDDGIVEAIEKTGSECVIGVQFHPEGFVAEDNTSLLPLFRHLVQCAADYICLTIQSIAAPSE